jgi:hypothetical protein
MVCRCGAEKIVSIFTDQRIVHRILRHRQSDRSAELFA